MEKHGRGFGLEAGERIVSFRKGKETKRHPLQARRIVNDLGKKH